MLKKYENAYRPKVEYTVDGQKYTFWASSAGSGYKDKVGSKVKVNYDPRNPSKAWLADKKELLFPAIMGICGLIAIALGFIAPSKR